MATKTSSIKNVQGVARSKTGSAKSTSSAKKVRIATVAKPSATASSVGAARSQAAIAIKRPVAKNSDFLNSASSIVASGSVSTSQRRAANSQTKVSRPRVTSIEKLAASVSSKKDSKSSSSVASSNGTGQKIMNTIKTGRTTSKDRKGQAHNSNGNAVKQSRSDLDIEYFRGLLLSERGRLEIERDQIRNRGGEMDGAMPEEGEGEEDTADMASAMMDKEFDLSVEDEIEELLASVDHALQKMDDGTYGVCDMSGEPIPRGRLELIPWASLTVECQALSEGE